MVFKQDKSKLEGSGLQAGLQQALQFVTLAVQPPVSHPITAGQGTVAWPKQTPVSVVTTRFHVDAEVSHYQSFL